MIKRIFLMVLVVGVMFVGGHFAYAVDGVAGCGAIEIDPSASLEFQQTVCNAAENEAATSCGATGHGVCSSPKVNDTMPSGTHCLCIGESTEDVSAESEPESEG